MHDTPVWVDNGCHADGRAVSALRKERVVVSKNASPEAARPAAGRVLLVHLDPEIGSPLRSRASAAGDTVFEEREGREEAIARLEGAEPVDAVVLGPRLDQPIQTAQRAHVVDPDVTVLILTEPARLSPIAHALELAPFLGGAVRCRAIGDPAADLEALLADIADAVAHTRRQRSLRTAVAAANGRMAEPATLDRQAARFLGHLLDHLPVGVIALEGAGLILAQDARAGRILGQRERDAIGTPLARLFHASAQREWSALAARASGVLPEAARAILRLARPVGRAEWLEVAVAALTGRAGEPGLLVLVQDVTDRVEAEREREEALGRLAFLARTSAVVAASLDYTVTLRSLADLAVPHLADLCAVDVVEEGGGVRRLALVHADPAEARRLRELPGRRPERREAGSPVPSGRSELLPELADGSADELERLGGLRELGVKSAMIVPLAARGRTLGTITFGLGDSGRRYTRADLELAEGLARQAALALDDARLYRDAELARAHAEAASRAKDEFLVTMSHELRAPLTAILGWAWTVRRAGFDSGTTARALEAIERNARAQARIIDDLLDVSRISMGKLRLQIRRLELPAVIRAALDTVRPAAEAKGIRLECVLDPGVGAVAGDRDRLQQVVWNLLANAVKFTPPGGRVAVRLDGAAGQARITLCDTGTGIRPVMPYIFERFRQADSTAARAYGGLGLGLAIVRHLVELHGGTVAAASPGEGGGATFTVILPLAAPARGGPPARALDGVSVLVVDDEPDARELLTVVLRHYGATVTAVESAGGALESLERARPDVLVSDIGMPGEDGYTLIRRIRAMEPEGRPIPAIALTAYARTEERARALRAGYQRHVAKPVEPLELASVIASLAGRAAPV
jgi:PAS domain S-box-containing protein